MAYLLRLAAVATLASCASAAVNRTALLWLVPYQDVTSVAGYMSIWGQLQNATGGRTGYIAAGSAYALKHNGSLGYATTTAGEGLYGDVMEHYGFPALKALGLRTMGMMYFTHYDGMKIVLANPQPFIDAVVAKMTQQQLLGVDVDYEPQNAAAAERDVMSDPHRPATAVDFHGFIVALAKALDAAGLIMTMDVGGSCGGNFGSGCASYAGLPGFVQMNSEDTFGVTSVGDFKDAAANNAGAGLGQMWAPGFEPGNCGADVFSQVLSYASSAAGNVTRLATW